MGYRVVCEDVLPFLVIVVYRVVPLAVSIVGSFWIDDLIVPSLFLHQP